VPADLLTSQLFGHERGSFTGASTRHIGLFEQAEGGTLFLDELSEMPTHLQVHLLRALETRQIRRVGGSEDIAVDVRIVSATNRPHVDAIDSGRLREDLYYRLAEFPMALPPLRDRPADILPIATLFLKRLNDRYGTRRTLTREGAELLQRYRWPGNIRELKNIIQRAYILAESDRITPGLPVDDMRPVAETASTITLRRSARRCTRSSAACCSRRWLTSTTTRRRPAQVLGITTKTIYNRLSSYKAAAAPAEEALGTADTDREARDGDPA